jgi:NRPS condensation-like uncharacterized protein
MQVVIPSFGNKRYLSGFDWVMGVVDHVLKKTTCAGNISQLVFKLDSPVDPETVQSCLYRFIKEFPVLYGRVARDYNLAPYWQVPKKDKGNSLNFNSRRLENSPQHGNAWSLMEEWVNTPFKNGNEHSAFHLLNTNGGESYFAMTFDHRLFDARGAESFVHLFQQHLTGGCNSHIGDVRLTSSAELSQWADKFRAGKNINRKIIALSKTSMRSLPVTQHCEAKKGFKFSLIGFDSQKTGEIHEKAYEEAGYLMVMPYLLSVAIRAMHILFESRGLSADSYIIPVSVDMRSSQDIKQELFFNYASMFLFQIHVDMLNDKKALINEIKSQMYEQVQSSLPQNLLKASLLLRIAPLSLLRKIFLLPFGGKFASFYFSHIGKCSYQYPEFMGSKISNIFHMPRVPTPPGIGIIFNSFNGQLNAVISWLDGLVSDDEILALENSLRSDL